MQRSRINRFLQGLVLLGAYALCAALFSSPLVAQPPASNPNEMCGDGTRFFVDMPPVRDNPMIESDQIIIPRGCDIYLLIVSDYGRNRKSDELLFYPLAKYVAEHNGYVHYAWWNNFLQPYMAGALHRNFSGYPNDPGPLTTVGTVEELFGVDLIGPPGHNELYITDVVRKLEIGPLKIGLILTASDLLMLRLRESLVNVPDDEQLVSDAKNFVSRVRIQNPNALILLVGHGLGAQSIVKVARDQQLVIDLLAPIDPVGNEALPVGYKEGRKGLQPEISSLAATLRPAHYARTYPHTRWRATHDFKGYQQADCIRGGGIFGLLCKDFDPRFLYASFRCKTPGPNWQETDPFPDTRAPLLCPGPLVHPGTEVSIRENVKFLYHRWQSEAGPPDDYDSSYFYKYVPDPQVSNTLAGPNVQGRILRSQGDVIYSGPPPFYAGPERTCGDQSREGCDPLDGHDEIVGFRGLPLFHAGAEAITVRTPVGVQARQWPSDTLVHGYDVRESDEGTNSAERRLALLEMTVPDPEQNWVHAPERPQMCLVCNDLVTIATNLLAQKAATGGGPPAADVTPPTIAATPDPGANANGWHPSDVVVSLHATDESVGSGVKQIQYSAPVLGTVVESGNSTQVSITAEGTTPLSYFATDNANNSSAAALLEIKIDKTSPMINAVTDSEPNGNGWLKNAVLVSFPASDEVDGSGLASSTAEVAVSTEGTNQEINGAAEDNAGNAASASVILNLDLTAPGITFASRTPAANAEGWNNSDVTFTWDCTDALSGPASPSVTQSVSTEGAAQTVTGACMDLADNTANDIQANINLDKTKPTITITTPADGTTYLLNAAVNSNYGCADGVSGIESCSGPVANGSAVNTSAVGDKQFLVNSGDVAGNQASSTHNYAVHYDFSGFGNPIAPMPIVNVVKAGRVVMIRYVLQDANGALLSDLRSFVSLTSVPAACDASAPAVLGEDSDPAGSTGIRYDADSMQFIYNWKTVASWAGTCRAAQLTLNDGTRHLALFQFK